MVAWYEAGMVVRPRTSARDLARAPLRPAHGTVRHYGNVGPVPVYQSASCPSVTADLVSGQCVECCQESITRPVLGGREGAEQQALDAQSGSEM